MAPNHVSSLRFDCSLKCVMVAMPKRTNTLQTDAPHAAKSTEAGRAARGILPTMALLLLSVAFAGCHRGIYSAASLPQEFAAPPATSVQLLDLSQLASKPGVTEMIQPGDVVEVTIATGLEQQSPTPWPLRVSDQGDVTVPLVGAVRLAGYQLTDADSAIRRASVERGVYRDPQVSVLLKSRRTNRVTVMGAVQEPGTYELPAASSDLLAALVAAGGITNEADTIVEIRHPPSAYGADPRSGASALEQIRTTRIDLLAATSGNYDNSDGWYVEDAAVVMVKKKAERSIYVMGLVRKPDEFEMPLDRDMRLLDALAMAGGRTMEVADKVHIIRNLPEQDQPIVVQASVNEAKRDAAANIRLAAGDVVSVEETPLTFTIDTLRSFIRFGFSSTVPGF